MLIQSRPASTIAPPRTCSGGWPAGRAAVSPDADANGTSLRPCGDDEIAARRQFAEERRELYRRVATAAIGPENDRQFHSTWWAARPDSRACVSAAWGPPRASPGTGPFRRRVSCAIPRTAHRGPTRSLISRGITMLTLPLCRSTVTRAPSGTVQDVGACCAIAPDDARTANHAAAKTMRPFIVSSSLKRSTPSNQYGELGFCSQTERSR